MIAQLVFGLLLTCSLVGQTRVELTKQVKGTLPPDKGGTGVSSCLDNEGLVWQSGEFACSALASGPHAPTHQDGGADEVATVTPSANAIPKSKADSTLSDGWLPGTISRDITWTGSQIFKQANGILLSTEFDGSQDPGTNLELGANTVTLTPCPAGVNGTNSNHYLYVDDNNNALDEAVLITGGTCTSKASSGTVEFTILNSHISGQYTLGSATAGIQEAVWALSDNNPSGGGVVYVPPGTHDLYQTLTIGDGTSTKSVVGSNSSINHVRLIGAGPGEALSQTDNTTVLRWKGPSGGEMVVMQGPIKNPEISGLHILGNNSIGKGPAALLRLYGSKKGTYRNLVLSHGKEDSIALDLNTDSNTNIFEKIIINNPSSGASGLAIGQNNPVGGASQNIFLNLQIHSSHNKTTSYNLYLGNADNNSFYQVNVFPRLVSITGAVCGNPTEVTTSIDHRRQTGVLIRIIGTGACGGSQLDGEWTITNTGPATFELDGSNHTGSFSGSSSIGGPGYSLFLDKVAGTLFPLENNFIATAFQNAFVASSGDHGPNMFFALSTFDNEDSHNGNTGGVDKYDRFTGFGGPLNYLPIPEKFQRIIGKWMIVKNTDFTVPYVKFYSDDAIVGIGDVDASFTPNNSRQLTIRKVGADSAIRLRTETSGDTLLEFQNVGNQTYHVKGNRTNNKLEIGNTAREFVTFDALTGRATFAESIVPGNVTQASLPADGIVYCTNCNQDSACTSGGPGAWARCRGGSCGCNW